MNDILQKLGEMQGAISSTALGNALIGLSILIIGLLLVKIITGLFSRILSKVSFLNQQNADGTASNIASPIISLIKAVLTVFVLIAVLQYFGLNDVLAPLKEMLNKFMSVIPNVIGAGVIAYAGWMIAKIIAKLAGVALSKVDEKISEKMNGKTDFKLSKFGNAFIFAIILLPITVAALGVLNIPAISEPASSMINQLMAAIPNIIGAGIILLVAYFVTQFVISMLSMLLEGMNIDAIPEKLGVKHLFNEDFTLTKLVSSAIMFFAMLTATTAAINTLGIEIISTIFAKILEFGGGILIGALILIIGNFLSNLAYENLKSKMSQGIANIARFAILGLVLAMGLKAMGLADNIVNLAFGVTIGGVAIAFALAFGLGGRDAAKTITTKWAEKITKT